MTIAPESSCSVLHDGTTINELAPVEDRLISTRIMNDAEIFDLELEKIFDRTWIFVGHESEIPRSNDFITRYIGHDPVIVSRCADKTVRVLLNICSHRGSKVCRADRGSAATFQCPYHGWTYRNTGQLLGVPLQREFSDLDKSQLGLTEARVSVFHGLIFATWNPEAPSLIEYLGDMAFYYDLVFGLSEMEVVGPPQRWVVKMNWKLAAENFSTDNYHTMTAHKFAVELGLMPELDGTTQKSSVLVTDTDHHGHVFGTGGMPSLEAMPEDDAMQLMCAAVGLPPHLVREVHERLTPQQRRAFVSRLPSVGTLFPNFSWLNVNIHTERGASLSAIPPHMLCIRLWQPRGADETEIWSWALVYKDSSDEVKDASRRTALRTFGSGGTWEQDDTEIWAGLQNAVRGVRGRQRYLPYPAKVEVDPSITPGVARVGGIASSDDTQLEFYRRWRELMNR